MKLGFLGGTGIEGKGLALRFAQAGANVLLGSRSEERAVAAARSCNEILGRPSIQGTANSEMLARSEIVFLTVPSEQALSAVESVRHDMRAGLILVDVTVPVVFRSGKIEYLEPGAGSSAEAIAERLPDGVDVVAAFKTIPADVLADIATPLQCDIFVCGDSKPAKERVIAAAALIPSLRALDAGPLTTARTIERMTVLAIHLNRRYKSKAARFRIVGVQP